MARACFSNVSQFPIPETLFPASVFCFQDANYAYATRQGILTKIRACDYLQNFCGHEQASTHLIFASNSSKGQILRALSNWMGPFDTPVNAKRESRANNGIGKSNENLRNPARNHVPGAGNSACTSN